MAKSRSVWFATLWIVAACGGRAEPADEAEGRDPDAVAVDERDESGETTSSAGDGEATTDGDTDGAGGVADATGQATAAGGDDASDPGSNASDIAGGPTTSSGISTTDDATAPGTDDVSTVQAAEPPRGCFDLDQVQSCADSSAPPEGPVELLRAQDIGEGYEFTLLADNGALARAGQDWALIWLSPRSDQAVWVASLEWPGAGAFELRGLAFPAASDHLAVLFGCDEDEHCALLGFDEDPASGHVVLYEVDESVSLEGALGIGTFSGDLCVYGAGLQCFLGDDWLQLIDSDVTIVDMQGRLALDDAGNVYEFTAEDGRPWTGETIEANASFSRLGGGVALADDGTLLYPEDDTWRECHSDDLLAATMTSRLRADGRLVVQDWRYPSQPCRVSMSFDDGPLVAAAEYFCGLSSNWLLMTKTTLWAAVGKLTCAIG